MKSGLTPEAYTNALGEGIARARAKTGIEGRMIVTGVRHFGVEVGGASRPLRGTLRAPAGERLRHGGRGAFRRRRGLCAGLRDRAREAGLGITVHAGELAGWESVKAALDHIRPSRIGHGVRAMRHRPGQAHRRRGRRSGMLPGLEHLAQSVSRFRQPSLPALKAAGCKVTLNSDDPPYFHTSLKREYDIAAEHFGLNDKALTAVTRVAIEAAFVDRKTKRRRCWRGWA